MTMTQTHGMTAAAEVWRVNDDESQATLLEGVYGDCEALRLSSAGQVLSAGEGLAGAVLARKVPVLLDKLDGESFERLEAASSGGVVAAVALPVFDEAKLTGVAVIMFRGAPEMIGAVELWAGRRGRFELGLTEAHYAGLERFGKVSRHVNFPMGSGLPGLVWQTAMPRVMSGLGQSREFLRSSGAETAGLTDGFGYPVIYRNELKAVMLWLSSGGSPLARLHEVWRSGEAGVQRMSSVFAPGTEAWDANEVVARSARERRPVVFDDASVGGGWSGGIALPVLVHDRVSAVGVLAW
ncbi:MAG: hypothetical protein AAGH92_11110 [Planctomycetota bacterium]